MSAKYLLILLILSVASCALSATPGDLSLPNAPIRFAIIGDRTAQHTPGVYEEIVAEVEELKPDFVITVGDAIEGYTEDTLTLNRQWDEYLSIVKPLTMPIYFTPGNHDITYDRALGPYQNKIGKPYYSFNVRNYHFIVLDVTRWESSERLPKTELEWLANDLASHSNAAQTLVFFHKPFWYNSISLGKSDTLHSLFKTYGVDAVFNGHLHSYFSAWFDGIRYTSVGSSGGIIDALPGDLDYHFTWVTVTDSGISIAPIRKGSVKPWDIVTAADEHAIDKIIRTSLKFTTPAPVTENSKVTSAAIVLDVDNLAAEQLDDTLKWQIPDGWSIQPISKPLTAGPGEKKQVEFQVSCSGSLYPLPIITLSLPYAKAKKISISKNLRITRIAVAPLVSHSPHIDGKLDDNCWSNPISEFYDPDGIPASIESTWFYFSYDRENLYLAAHCLESHIDSLHAGVTVRDGAITGEDCVGFFIQPDCGVDTAYQIYFNPKGMVFDQKIYLGSLGYFTGDKSWNGNYQAKTAIGDRYWDLEAQIPLAQLKVTASSGQRWGLNFLRKQKRLGAASDWQVPVDYDPQTFGVLLLR